MHTLYAIQEVFREQFDDPDLVITEDYSSRDHPEWDSVATVQIVLTLEAQFQKRFPTGAVGNIQTVKDLMLLMED